jgi:hypothetical protein
MTYYDQSPRALNGSHSLVLYANSLRGACRSATIIILVAFNRRFYQFVCSWFCLLHCISSAAESRQTKMNFFHCVYSLLEKLIV